MNIRDLENGDYVVIQFNPGTSPQLAEVKSLNLTRNEAQLLPELQTETILISSEDQWEQIQPLQIVNQVLQAFGFSNISLDIAYGWTYTQWTKVSYDQKHIFNLSYQRDRHTWNLEINSLVNHNVQTVVHEGIIYVHELQHYLMSYNP